MKVTFYTLGCKVNQNETGALQELFRTAGFTIAQNEEEADVYIVNSCTVTAEGDAKSRRWLRRAKRANPAAVTVLTGCFPQAFPENMQIPEADIITGTAARGLLVQHVNNFMLHRKPIVEIVPHSRTEAYEELPGHQQDGRTRAFVKVEDGCNRRCAYCIIPTARGPVRSRGEASILAELATLAASGYAEVVFTGINLPSYGKDTNTDLAELVEKAAQIEGLQRIRLSSLDPDLITPLQIQRFARIAKLCPHFHLSLQSGCDATLRRMRRPYTTQQYAQAAAALRNAIPHASFTTDVIVGFPGETEEEFTESLAFIKSMGFLKVHVFPYSARPGTPAADFPNQISRAEKSRRAALLQREADAVRNVWIARQQGSTQQVLLEKPDASGLFTGYTGNYIPVLVHAPHHKQGQVVTVTLGTLQGERCTATLLTP